LSEEPPYLSGLVMKLADITYSEYVATKHERSNRSQTTGKNILAQRQVEVNSTCLYGCVSFFYSDGWGIKLASNR
jgi:capsule polysaccharide export protein KpsC/LpsZ